MSDWVERAAEASKRFDRPASDRYSEGYGDGAKAGRLAATIEAATREAELQAEIERLRGDCRAYEKTISAIAVIPDTVAAREDYAAGLETAARFIEANSVLFGSTNEMRPRRDGDRGGLDYAAAIRALAEKSQEAPTAPDGIASVLADLASGQKPLGAEFEAVWDANAKALYEADTAPTAPEPPTLPEPAGTGPTGQESGAQAAKRGEVTDAMVERAARAAHEADGFSRGSWRLKEMRHFRKRFRLIARAALEAALNPEGGA